MESIPVELGGKTRNMRYSINHVCAVEEMAGKPITAIDGVSSIRLLVWGALRHENKGLTLTQVGTWIQTHLENGGSVEELVLKARKALKMSGLFKEETPESEETDDEPGEK